VFQLHPSLELRERFVHRPFQGAQPHAATFLFVGLDANYSPSVEDSPCFRSILEYHADGVAFWQRHGVHHPFLLPNYRGDGRRYHLNFSRIGFTGEHASLISFVELLHAPTVGRSKLTSHDLDVAHLQSLSAAILRGNAKHIFVSSGVARMMRETRLFSWLPRQPMTSGTLPIKCRENGRTVYMHLHFSNYGKFQAQLNAEAKAIRTLL
jgi:hypothetical protein